MAAVAFDVYDANGDGSLSLTEMIQMMSAAFVLVADTEEVCAFAGRTFCCSMRHVFAPVFVFAF